MPPQRIMILGPPGSGKSTLARRLGTELSLPVFHLDQLYFQPGWVETPVDAFYNEVERLAAAAAWVIEGNYRATIHPRLQRADTLIYLDTPNWQAMWRILKRTLSSHGKIRPDSAAGCPERINGEFLRFVWTWNKQLRAAHLAIVASFPGKTHILKTTAAGRIALA